MKETDLVFPGDWIAVDNVIYLAARVDHEKIGLFNMFTGQRWTEPTDYCGQAPLGGTPLINFCVTASARPRLIRREKSSVKTKRLASRGLRKGVDRK